MWDSVALQLETVISACDFCCVGLWVGLITAAIACEMQAVFWGCEPVKKTKKSKCFCAAGLPCKDGCCQIRWRSADSGAETSRDPGDNLGISCDLKVSNH